MEAELLRSLERLTVVLVGGLSIYLGYLMFLKLPEQKDSEGRLNLPGDISIYLTRVGPGTFFGLFGALIVTASLYFSVTIYDEETGKPVWHGAGPREQAGNEFDYSDIDQANLKAEFSILNKAESYFATDTPSEYRADWSRILPDLKLKMLKSEWQSSWGSYEQFESIILDGDFARLDDDFGTPMALYRSGQ